MYDLADLHRCTHEQSTTHQYRNLVKPTNNQSTNLHPKPITVRPINHRERDPSTTHDPRRPPNQNPLTSTVSPWPTSLESTPWVRDPPCHDLHRHLTHAEAHARKYPPPWAKERCDERKESGLGCYGERESRSLRRDTKGRERFEIWNKK